ncbi:unnamed protein product [Camellia sinensis]
MKWLTFIDSEGRIIDSKALRKRIFYGGVDPGLRKEVWPFLLGYHAYDSTSAEREYLMSVKKSESISREQAKSFTKFRERKGLIDEDVVLIWLGMEMKSQGIDENRLRLLRDVSGAFRPGILTALVGVSGAGKTTLMDVLAGRKTGGYIEGNISISGYPKNQETFARVSGYCEQNDIHSPFVTVHESLLYSAWLRLSKDVKTERKQMFVAEVMDLVELNTLKNALVGLPGVNGLSTEQRKRLTIAVELVANPSIIFMDEPTSGLDARAAAIVMRTVRNTVDTGRTVVCTIHQPSIDIFEAFDELLLMKRGGNMIYAGPLGRHSHKLVEYFEAVPGVPNITEGYNPATWMLDVSSTSVEAQLDVDFAEIYANSGLYQNQELIKELSTPAPGTNDLYFPTKYSQSLLTQCLACFWKQHWSYWRNSQHQQQDLLNLLGATYSAVLFLGASNANAVQIVVVVERTVFYHERAAGMYSELPYAFAQVAIETIYVVIQTFIYAFLLYSMIGFEWTTVKFFYFYYFIFMCFTYFSMYGMMVVALTPNHQIAAIVMSFFFSFWNLFSGFLIPGPGNRDHMVGWVNSQFRSLLVKVTAQDVSTMLRCEQRTIIFLIEPRNFCFLVDAFIVLVCIIS